MNAFLKESFITNYSYSNLTNGQDPVLYNLFTFFRKNDKTCTPLAPAFSLSTI